MRELDALAWLQRLRLCLIAVDELSQLDFAKVDGVAFRL
jgi:hypothetical protein